MNKETKDQIKKNHDQINADEIMVNIAEHAYNPPELTVKVGSPVIFVNDDSDEHTVTSIEGFFDEEIPSGESKIINFENVGTYDYYCRYHPDMQGTVVVEE